MQGPLRYLVLVAFRYEHGIILSDLFIVLRRRSARSELLKSIRSILGVASRCAHLFVVFRYEQGIMLRNLFIVPRGHSAQRVIKIYSIIILIVASRCTTDV